MAKETKAERTLREAMVREAMLAEQAATYPQRLMALMQRAQLANFKLTVQNMTFELSDRDDRYSEVFELDLFYSDVSNDQLENLSWRVGFKEEAALEANRKREARANALNKLSAEEKELLGL